jgi:hypothetical protein
MAATFFKKTKHPDRRMHLGSNRRPREATSVRGQPVIGGGTLGGIGVESRCETAEIPGLSSVISNPSRGVIKSITYKIVALFDGLKTEEDVQRLVDDRRREDLHLEFKEKSNRSHGKLEDKDREGLSKAPLGPP